MTQIYTLRGQYGEFLDVNVGGTCSNHHCAFKDEMGYKYQHNKAQREFWW
jgi:hypothetical protein